MTFNVDHKQLRAEYYLAHPEEAAADKREMEAQHEADTTAARAELNRQIAALTDNIRAVEAAVEELRRVYDVEYVEGGRATLMFEEILAKLSNHAYVLASVNPIRGLDA